MNIICNRCSNYDINPCGTIEICHAFRDRQTRFTNGITKEYISHRMDGEKNHCKEYKMI